MAKAVTLSQEINGVEHTIYPQTIPSQVVDPETGRSMEELWNLDRQMYEVVTSLPLTNIQEGKVYLVQTSTPGTYTQYLWNGSSWTNLGQAAVNVLVEDSLNSGSRTMALSAYQGREMNYMITGQKIVSPEEDFEHYKDGYQLLATAQQVGKNIDNVGTTAQATRMNVKVPLSGMKAVSFYAYKSTMGYGSLIIDADGKVLAAYTNTTGERITVVVPEGAAYLVYSYALASWKIVLYGTGIDQDIENIETELGEVKEIVTDTPVDLSAFEEYGAFASGAEVGATWSTSNKSIFIPVEGGASYKITGNHGHTSFIMFVTAVYTPGDTIHWATGWNRRRPIVYDKTEIITAPTMAGQQVYLCVLTSDAAGTVDYRPTIKLMGKLDKQGVNVHLFTFADATERIPIVTTADADVSQYDNSIIGLHSTIRIGEYLYCFYLATDVAPANVTEYSYRVCAAYSQDGLTWTRGFHSPDIHPSDGIEGTNVVIRSRADGKAYSLSDICIVRVPDNEYPYRMIGQKTTPPPSGTLTVKEMWMWKSADCFSWVEMNKIVNGRYDTATSAIVCGQVIKLYIRNWDHSIPSGNNKDRRIGRAYVDIWGNLLTPPHFFFGNYLYNAGASKIDDRRELLLPTYFDWNVTNVQDIELRSYLVDGDDVKEITTNINDALTASEKWAWVMAGQVSVNCEQYVSMTTAERYHNDKTVAKSGIYLVKVQMNDGVSDQNDD